MARATCPRGNKRFGKQLIGANDLPSGRAETFRRLSIFLGLHPEQSICLRHEAGSWTDILDGMTSMVDKSLIRQTEQTDGEPRFVMLETIREYGLKN